MENHDLTSLEALGIAIRSEIDAQEVYAGLAERMGNDILKERFLNLCKEEKKHQFLLEQLHKEMFPDVEIKLPPSVLFSTIDKDKELKDMSIKDVLQLAINEEKHSREFYLDCEGRIKDLSGKRMFRFLADMEFSHQHILTAELEMIEKYPAYHGDTKLWEAETSLRKDKFGTN